MKTAFRRQTLKKRVKIKRKLAVMQTKIQSKASKKKLEQTTGRIRAKQKMTDIHRKQGIQIKESSATVEVYKKKTMQKRKGEKKAPQNKKRKPRRKHMREE
jgi:hypothetical protein